MAMMYAGDAEAGLRHCKRALEANPRFPANNWFMDYMAVGNFLREDYGAAVEWARRSDEIHGDIPRCLLLLTTCYSHAGAVEEAAREADRLMQQIDSREARREDETMTIQTDPETLEDSRFITKIPEITNAVLEFLTNI